MANDPAFLFYPGDYLRDTQNLSTAAQVAYDRIMCEHMRNICISYEQHKFFTKRLTDDERAELRMVLTEESGVGFFIGWVRDSILKRRQYSESRRNNRSASKEKKGKKICESYVEHMENENVIENKDEKGKGNAKGNGRRKIFIPPELNEVEIFFQAEGFPRELAEHVWKYYSDLSANGKWYDGQGNEIRSWKSKMRAVWMKPENKNWNGKATTRMDKAAGSKGRDAYTATTGGAGAGGLGSFGK